MTRVIDPVSPPAQSPMTRDAQVEVRIDLQTYCVNSLPSPHSPNWQCLTLTEHTGCVIRQFALPTPTSANFRPLFSPADWTLQASKPLAFFPSAADGYPIINHAHQQSTPTMDSTTAITDWETYLEGATPCRFPRFSRPGKEDGAASASPQQLSSAPLDVEQADADKLMALSTTDLDGLCAVLRTAWAMLLRCYTGQDDVCFNYQQSGDVASDPIVARFLHDDSASIAGTVGRARAELAGDLPPIPTRLLRSGHSDHPAFDTALVVCGPTKRSAPWSKVFDLVRRSLRDPHHQAFNRDASPDQAGLANTNNSNSIRSASLQSAERPA